jgi:UDP-N-acetyl-D-mannosaminuronic acid transferase (WecB/TagA/CpsF family)
MNKRIQELALQAKLIVPQGLSVDKWIETYNEKLANIIIFECIKIAVFKGDATTGRAIKEHFGVEE